jgi:hypothetical protein
MMFFTDGSDEAVSDAYSAIFGVLAADFPSTTIQRVQDSVVFECAARDIPAVRELVANAMCASGAK